MTRVGVIADTHINPVPTQWGYSVEKKQNLADALIYLNGLSPVVDSIVFGGDIGHYYKAIPTTVPHVDDTAYTEFLGVVNANWTKSFHGIAGNHDIPLEVFYRHFKELLPRVVTIGSLKLILINSVGGGSHSKSAWEVGHVPCRTLDWLEETLPTLSSPRVLFMHHIPVDLGSIDPEYTLPFWVGKNPPSQYFWGKDRYWNVINQSRLIDILSGEIEAVITGHLYDFTLTEGYVTVSEVDVVYQRHFAHNGNGGKHTILDVLYSAGTLTVTSHDMQDTPPTTNELLSKSA